jgi:uncharacterized protein
LITKNHKILIGANGRKFALDITYNKNTDSKGIILFLHGFKSFKDWGHFNQIAAFFAESNYTFIKLNFSHNGVGYKAEELTDFVDLEAFGNDNITNSLEDVKSVIDFILSCNLSCFNTIATSNILIMGHSKGGGLAVLAQQKFKLFSKIVTLAGIAKFNRSWTKAALEEWKLKGIIYVQNTRTNQMMPIKYQIVEDYFNNNYEILEAATVINIPWLIVHGSADETVNVEEGKSLSDANNGSELFIVNNASHTFGSSYPITASALPIHLSITCNKILDFLIK